MQLNPHHIFMHNGTLCLMNIERMKACFINDKAIARTIQNIAANPYTPISQSVAKELKQLGLLPAGCMTSKKERESASVPVRGITLFVTQKCNLRCTYCYGVTSVYRSGREMTRNTARKAVDWLIEQSKTVKDLTVCFFGGEPLLNFGLIKEVFQYARERGRQTGKQVVFGVTTNASMLDDEKITFFKENGIDVVVSFDGLEALQNKYRPFKDGKESYDTIVKKIRKLLKLLPESSCRATLVGNNGQGAVYNALHDIGFTKRLVVPASRPLFGKEDERESYERDVAGMLDRAESAAKQLLRAIQVRDTPTLHNLKNSGWLHLLVEAFVNHHKKHFRCTAGRSMVAVSCSGDLYLCHRFVGMEEYKLGDIFHQEFSRETYLTRPLTTYDKCSICFAKYLCGGGCYYDNLGKTGSIFEADEDGCALMRRETELAAYICSSLNDDDLAYVVEEKLIEKKVHVKDLFA